MDFNTIKTRCWRAIDDTPANPQLIDNDLMEELINGFLKKLGDVMYIERAAQLTITDGVAELPGDFISANAVYHGTQALKRISRIQDKADDTAVTSQYYIPNNTEIYVFGKTPIEDVTLYYYAYPAELTEDSDVPSELPLMFHSVFEMYIKTWYAFQTGDIANYATLTALIEQRIIPEIEHVCSRDKRPVIIMNARGVDDEE